MTVLPPFNVVVPNYSVLLGTMMNRELYFLYNLFMSHPEFLKQKFEKARMQGAQRPCRGAGYVAI